jgi:hypothetical protein
MPLRSSTPPSLRGRVTKGMSSTLAGGYSSPVLGTSSPVALATAVLSIDGLLPSRKLLNIFGFRPPRVACSGVRPQCPTPCRACSGCSAAATCGRARRPPPGSRRCAPSPPGRRSAPAGRRRPGCTARRPRRPRASSGPQNASASTVTLTTCLPCAKAARQWSTAAMGWPVHSTTMSIAGCRTSACQSSPTWVLPSRSAASRLAACTRCGSQPTRARLRQAASGDRSAMPPGARPACAAPGPGTSSRTCPRRSGRRGWGGLRRRAVAVDGAGSWKFLQWSRGSGGGDGRAEAPSIMDTAARGRPTRQGMA